MMHTRRTLYLNRETWDLETDGVGRVALASGEYATAQNVANEARLFTEDAYFIQDRGIPHFTVTLGRHVNNAVLRSYLREAALSVPDVREVTSVTITGFDPESRKLSGDIQFTTEEGVNNGTIRTYF